MSAKDVTGCTPAELASEKGHRYLANYLREYKEKEDNQHKLCGKAGALSWLTSTQLCPVIWLIIIGLVALFVHKVRLRVERGGWRVVVGGGGSGVGGPDAFKLSWWAGNVVPIKRIGGGTHVLG